MEKHYLSSLVLEIDFFNKKNATTVSYLHPTVSSTSNRGKWLHLVDTAT